MRHRIRDLLFAFVILIFLFPLFAAISAAILLFHGKPVFYREKRAGFHGKPFTIFKFRTLVANQGKAATTNDLENRIVKNGTPENCSNDFFKFLRKYSLDELPQIWNVLKGDMSLVGPRPMPPDELDYRFGPDASKVTSVLPGMTGLWQISGRNDLPLEERHRLDLFYVETKSPLGDCKIILKTFYAVLSGRGAY
ncbi:MAG: sugar transferase [Smithellaceae bacterium]